MSFNISSMRRSVLAGKSKLADLAKKKSCLSASGGTCSLVQYTFQRAALVHVEGCSTCVVAKASNLEFCGSRHASSQEESFTR